MRNEEMSFEQINSFITVMSICSELGPEIPLEVIQDKPVEDWEEYIEFAEEIPCPVLKKDGTKYGFIWPNAVDQQHLELSDVIERSPNP